LTNHRIDDGLRINAEAISPERQLEKTRENPLTRAYESDLACDAQATCCFPRYLTLR
jgi:hypothetical protein